MSTLSASAAPFQNPKFGNNDILPALVEEQSKAARDLESYIAEFARKVEDLHTKPSDAELVILFVMNLQLRWKRLVEPLEPTFVTWTEAAQVARYHSAKMTALLGPNKKDNKVVEEAGFTFFGNKESEKLLTSGYFVPDNHPRKGDFAGREQPALKKDTIGTPQVSLSLSTSNKQPSRKNKKNSSNSNNSGGPTATSKATATTTTATTTTTTTTTKKKKTSAPQQNQPPAAANGYDWLTMLQESVTQAATEADLKLAQVYDQVPSEHRNVQLPFLELKVAGQKISALLAKNRWGASVMSVSLLKKLNLLLEPEGGCDIATEFGLVTASIGSTFLPLGNLNDPENILVPLDVQVVPKLYGGKVDLILGADFFFCFNASFTDVENRKIRFLDIETTFIAKELK